MYWEGVMLSSYLPHNLWHSMVTSGIIDSNPEPGIKKYIEFIDDGMNKEHFKLLTEIGSVLIGVGMKDLAE